MQRDEEGLLAHRLQDMLLFADAAERLLVESLAMAHLERVRG